MAQSGASTVFFVQLLLYLNKLSEVIFVSGRIVSEGPLFESLKKFVHGLFEFCVLGEALECSIHEDDLHKVLVGELTNTLG